MNQYRCETCKKECKITVVDSDYSKPISFNPKDPIESTEYFVQGISQVGCASHSDFQSGWDTVLDILRPEVLTFALLMERKLRKHDKDRGDSYKTTDVDYLLMRLREEVKELHNAIEDDPWDGKGVSLGESVDVGNISMMIGYHDYQFPMDVFIEELVEELRQAGEP